MSWTEFWMLLINGGILIIFRCWVESKWRRRDQEKQQKDDSTHTRTKAQQTKAPNLRQQVWGV